MHWAEVVATKFSAPERQVICAGITPSGDFHIGHLREILTCDIIYRAVRQTEGYSFEDYKSEFEGALVPALSPEQIAKERAVSEAKSQESWGKMERDAKKAGYSSVEEAGRAELSRYDLGPERSEEEEKEFQESERKEWEEEETARAKELTEKNIWCDFFFIVDSADPLRKVYPFLHPDYEKFVGHQLGNIPPPDTEGKPDYVRFDEGQGDSYADHYLAPFMEALKKIGVRPEVIDNLGEYQRGDYAQFIDRAFEKSEEIKEIIEQISGRELPENWNPFDPIGSDGSLDGVTVTKYEKPLVYWVDRHGVNGKSDIYSGEVWHDDVKIQHNNGCNVGKLPWRIEWPAKWALFDVACEPFGKDHGAAGGSYDTGKEIIKLFDDKNGNPCKAPFPLTYEWISIKGGGAMSSSTGNAISPLDVLELMPPHIIRYLIAKPQPKRHIDFDVGSSLIELSDEYQKAVDWVWSDHPSRNWEGLSRRQKKSVLNDFKTILYSQVVDEVLEIGVSMDRVGDGFIDESGLGREGSITFRHLSLLAQMFENDKEVWKALLDSDMIYGDDQFALLDELDGQNIGTSYMFKDGKVISQDDFDHRDFLSLSLDNEEHMSRKRDWCHPEWFAAWQAYCEQLETKGWTHSRSRMRMNNATSTLPRRLQTIRNWISSEHFPEGFRLRIQTQLSEDAKENIDIGDLDYLEALKEALNECEWNAETINDNLCNLAHERGVKLRDMFQLMYWIVLDQNSGPTLKRLLARMEREAVLNLLDSVIDELSS
jgi:lysyl-tRNA synthetase class I